MEFTLTYDGPLPSNGDSKKKHAIRQVLHPQLQELWQHDPLQRASHQTEDDAAGGNVRKIVGGHPFTAVVHSFWNFRAKLDILLLKPEPPGRVLTSSGDIDNRLKTLFDALTMPTQAQDIPRGWTPAVGQNPLHCLLEDDALISTVSVRTERLLAAPTASHVRATIHVQVSTAWAFGGFAIYSPGNRKPGT